MKDSKSTKRALAASIGCVALCTAMLVGTTFAWFTDTASTSVNKIQSGTLDVAIVDGSDQALESLSFANNQGSDNILWEPGATFTTGAFYVKNGGSLALKCKLSIDGVDGDDELLSAIDFSVVDKNGNTVGLSDFEGNLTAGTKSDAYKIEGHMKESAGNEYQGKTLEGIKVSVTATQDTVEYDSTTNQYDSAAEYATPVASVDELQTALASGEDVVLTKSLEIPNSVDKEGNATALEVKSDVTIYGNGETKLEFTGNQSNGRVINVNDNASPVTLTLSGVEIVGPTMNGSNRGISVYGNSDVNIVIDNCTISANHYPLYISGENKKVNVTVRNSTLSGYCGIDICSPTTATFENCTLTGINQWPTGGSNDYEVIGIDSYAQNTSLTFKNCVIAAVEQNTAAEYLLGRYSDSSTVTFDGCTFYHNGTQVSNDSLNDYINGYDMDFGGITVK